ncbi:hypothetical protein [Paenibacillus jiagnxiensis]|uniref:hypothetical protein n=1 Tax=Paenibacillus jiagnxiensis TaxID=3228926 RepID=UPI00339EB944
MKTVKNDLLLLSASIVLMITSSCNSSAVNSNNNSDNPDKMESRVITKRASEYNVTNTDLEQLIVDGLKQRKDIEVQADRLVLDYPYYYNDSIFSTFLIEEEAPKIGLVYADWVEGEYKLQFIDLFPADKENPFSVISTHSKLSNDKQNFKAIFGYIDDKSITGIKLNYKENETTSVKVASRSLCMEDVGVFSGTLNTEIL